MPLYPEAFEKAKEDHGVPMLLLSFPFPLGNHQYLHCPPPKKGENIPPLSCYNFDIHEPIC